MSLRRKGTSVLHFEFAKLFSRSLIGKVVDRKQRNALLERVAQRYDQESTSGEMRDLLTRSHLRMAITVESAYFHLVEHENTDPIETLKSAMVDEAMVMQLGAQVIALMDNLDTLESACNLCADCFLGDSFNCSTQRTAENHLVLSVHRCFFNTYFLNRDCSFLTPIFCEFDDQFGKALGEKFRYTRRHTLSGGAPQCTFQFEKFVATQTPSVVGN